ncbi:hypothetical protein PS649_004106 [Salmonella enterica subsp. enterica serovar Kentucky]|nr:hypothetical protein [Salmonella enterica subsp. enterica serovar Kentucky]
MDSVHHIWCPLFSQEFQDLPDGAETTLTLERGHTKADIVADVLATAGFPDFGDQLKLLATSSLQKTHKLA